MISPSISSVSALQYYYGPIAIVAYAAMKEAMFVAAAAGNNGTAPIYSRERRAVVTSVGAGTVGRNNAKFGDGTVVEGTSLSGSDVRAGLLPLV